MAAGVCSRNLVPEVVIVPLMAAYQTRASVQGGEKYDYDESGAMRAANGVRACNAEEEPVQAYRTELE